jgi:exonuclease SbcC
VKLVSLYASNFKRLSFDSPLNFKDGVTVISGQNEAGKSTILDAVLYVLFGRVTRPPGHVKDDDLLAYQTKRSVVILEFELAGELYRVKREILKSGTNKASLDKSLGEGRWKALAVKSRDVTKAVEDLLGGISFEEMLSSNVVAQKDLGRLVDAKTDRWKVVNAFLHLESFTKVKEDLNDERNDLEGTGPLRPGTINAAKEKLDQLRLVKQECERRQDQNTELNKKIEELTAQNKELTEKYARLEALEAKLREYDETLLKRQKLNEDAEARQMVLDKHRESVSLIESNIPSLEAKLGNFEGLPSGEEVAPISVLLESAKVEGMKLGQLRETVTSKGVSVKRLENEIGPYDPNAAKAARANHSLKGPAVGLGISGIAAAITFVLFLPVVPWLLSAVAAAFALRLAKRVSSMSRAVRLEEAATKYRLYDKEKGELARLQEDLLRGQSAQEERESRLRQSAEGLTYYRGIDGGDIIQWAANVVKQYNDDASEYKHAKENLDGQRKTLADIRGQLNEASTMNEISDLRSQASNLVLPALPDGFVFTKGSLQETMRQKEATGRTISSNNATIESHRTRTSENEKFLQESEGIEGKVSDQEMLLRKLERHLLVTKFAKEGVEETADAIKARFRPGVERHMGEILPSLTMGRYRAALLDEDFSVKVFDPEAGEYRPRDVFSGGTDDQFLLAMRLAFVLSLLPEAKGTRPKFLWLDEPLGSSDEARRSGIIEYISAGLSKSFSQIFIVSHVGGLEELISNVIKLENGKLAA